MNIVIATLGLAFSGSTLKKSALGGSETAVIYVAKELVKLGHDVRVYCNCDDEGEFEGVQYRSIDNWNITYKYIDCDILIVSRFFDLARAKVNSKLNILWNHDTCASPDQLMSAIWGYDYLYCLSEFHKKDYVDALPELESVIKLNSNGVDFSLTQRLPKKHKIMFTSRPERGLMDALKVYELLGDKELEFLACNYKTLDVKEANDIEDLCNAKLQELGNKGFNVKLGRFTKEELYKHISESKAVLYPTQFPEIFCISAIEAQANGTVFVTTDEFAMKETVAYDGVKLSEEYTNEFMKRVQKVLSDDDYRIKGEELGLKHVQKYSWENVAKKFHDDFMGYFEERSKDINGVLETLDYESDLIAGRELAKKHNLTEKVKYFDHQLRFVDNPELLKELYEDEKTHEQIELPVADLERNPRFAWLADMVEKYELTNVLDFACHLGLSAILMSNRVPTCKVTGYDISERAMEKGKIRLKTYAKNPQNVQFVSNKADLKEGSFDGLFCGEYLEHVLDVEKEIAELEKYVKIGGKMFFTVPRGAWEWISREQNINNDVVYHVSHIDYQDIFDLFGHREGFELLSLAAGVGMNGEQIGQSLIQYTKDDKKVGKRNFERKFLVTRPYQSISACIIAKDASKDIEQCLDSFYKTVDEIIIAYDPNSKDQEEFKRRVSKYFNVKVFDMPKSITKPDQWGFANARNFSLSKATGKWILWVDSDERMILGDSIRKYLDTPLLNGYTIRQHHAQLDSFVEADRPTRLFRRGIAEFVGYIHEQPQLISDINAPVTPALVMDHAKFVNFGMLNEAMRREKSLGRNMELLKVDAEKNVDERKKAGLPIRKLTMILIMRDFYNRMQWGYEKYKTFKTKDVMELCLPQMKAIYNKHFRNETDLLYKEMAETILQTAYEVANIGIPCEIKIADKVIKKRVDLDDFDDFKVLVSDKLNNARTIS